VFIVVLVGIINNSWPRVPCLHIIICSLHNKVRLEFLEARKTIGQQCLTWEN
jgi:hypothetical protein